jgi:hypothetical protein
MARRNLNDLTTAERVELAKKKTQRLVDVLIDVVNLHEANRIVTYSPLLAGQIPQSFAANAFNSFQRCMHGFELIRLCVLWDPCGVDDLEKESIPAVINLISTKDVLDHLQHETWRAHRAIPTMIANEHEHSAEVLAAIRQAVDEHTEAHATQEARTIRRKLEFAIRWTRMLERSKRVEATRNYRDKHLAHSLGMTRLEQKRGPIGPMRYGYDRDLLTRTLALVNLLHLGINGAGFTWSESVRIARRNAEALWKGCTFSVIE